MLRVTYEIVPFGIEDHPKRRTIGIQNIGNLSDCAEDSLYSSLLWTDGGLCYLDMVEHLRSEGAFELVRKCLENHLTPD
jgi:hypothetical protein